MRRHVPTIVATWLLFAAAARADDGWTRTSADLSTVPATPTAIDPNGVTFTTAAGATETTPWAAIVRLARVARPAASAGLVLCTADGQRLAGGPVRVDGPNLVWRTDKGAEVPVPLESALAVLRDRTQSEELSTPRAEDVAKLTTGDAVRGVLTDATADAFTLTPAAGDPVKVVTTAVASILFASPPGARKAVAPPPFLVRVGGSTIACDTLTQAGDRLTLRLAGGTDVAAAFADVSAIEHTGGPVAWLSSRLALESSHTPYLDGAYPARMDTSVTGEPIRFGGVTYEHGIGVHSRSKLVFAVEPGDKIFRTRYAIDGPLSRADVDVRVIVDGKVVHERKSFKAGKLSPVVETDVTGAKTLTLEVDYGGGYDVQDRLNWIEPAMIRK